MKTLVLIRHAKSSWDFPHLRDYERPLNARGEKDAPEMARRLAKLDIKPDMVCSSGAERAIQTAKTITTFLHYPAYEIEVDDRIYHASSKSLLEYIKRIEHPANTIYLVGHNPGLTEFLNLVADENIENIPTCGIAGIEFRIEKWSEVKSGLGKLIFYDYPKKKSLLF